MRRWSLLVLMLGCSSAPQDAPTDSGVVVDSPAEDPALYLDKSLREQVDAMESGKITSSGLTSAYLSRVDGRDKEIHAVLARDPTANAQATAMDARRGKGELLHGAVILVKDNIDTKDLATTAGSIAMKDNVPARDAPTVAKLRAAGAVILGKTNLSEWANFRGEKSSSGWSSLGGQTNNGVDPAYNPCGSSSGSGAAVASGMASAALGTETDGSIVCPASVNGVVGFKPTVGLVSRAGVIPISHSQDTVGPITKNVGDAARLLRVLAGRDPEDAATSAIPASMSFDFEAPLATATLKGKRLGVVNFRFPATVNALFAAERARLESAGATVVDVAFDFSLWPTFEVTILLHELKFDLNAYLAAHARTGVPRTLQELIEFNELHKAEVMPFFGQELFIQSQATTGLDAMEYTTAKDIARTGAGKNGIDKVMADNSLDALIAPTVSPAWKTDHARGDPGMASSSRPAAVAGYPHLTVPMGLVDGRPVGMSFFAGAWQDGKVLALGHAYEQLPR
jgi:amidase